MEFEAPIPGQSLTSSPGKFPYERPPEINDPEEAIQMHLSRLDTPEMKTDIVDSLELDLDVRTLTEGILRSAVAEGIHSIDVSLVIAPVIHEFIKITADNAEIDYEEGLEDKKANEKKVKAVTKAKAAKMIEKFRNEPETEEVTDEPEPQGFMERRAG